MNGPFPHPDDIAKIYEHIVKSTPEGESPDFSIHAVASHVANIYGEQPHPRAPSLKIKDYPSYERVAWMLNDKQPTPADVTHAAQTLKGAGLSPAQFETTWAVARPVANRLIAKDPTMQQLVHLANSTPQQIHDYYMTHPYPGYEEVTAGQMVRAWRAAEPIARQYGHAPGLEHVARFAVTEATVDDMHDYYSER